MTIEASLLVHVWLQRNHCSPANSLLQVTVDWLHDFMTAVNVERDGSTSDHLFSMSMVFQSVSAVKMFF
jgi:hypothetical protein